MKRHESNDASYEALKTIAVVAAAAILFGLLFKVRALHYLALVLLIIGVFAKKWSMAIASGWMKFAEVVSYVNTRIILSAVFFVLLTPIALIYRMIHGDFMSLKKQDRRATYFVDREHTYGPQDLANPW
jgi:hypothetical protein